MTIAHANSITRVSTSAEFPLGYEVEVPATSEASSSMTNQGTQVWIYVFNDDAALNWLTGMLIQRDVTPGNLTYDGIRSTGAVGAARILGVAQHAIPFGSYGFILKKGVGQVLCDGNVSADTAILPDANAGQCTDGAVTSAAIGVALAEDSGAASLVAGYLNCSG